MKKGRLENTKVNTDLDDARGVDPLSSLSNFGDVMLVLAVGIMLALITAWNVDITLTDPGAADSAQVEDAEELEDAEEIGTVEISDETETVENSDLTEYGTVYIDSDGNYYVEPSK